MNIKRPLEVSAPKYVEYLMDWIETQLDDESVFPQKLGEAPQLCWRVDGSQPKQRIKVAEETKLKASSILGLFAKLMICFA